MARKSQLVTRTADQMTTFNSLVAAAVTLIVGVLIYNNIFDALPQDTGGAISASNVSNTIESAFLLAPVALIVLVASLVLLQIGGLSGRRGGGMGGGGNGGGM